MFEKMSKDDLISLLETIKEQQEAARQANDSAAIRRLIDKELLIRSKLNGRIRPQATKSQASKIPEWMHDTKQAERRCPLCGRVISCDGAGFARHLADDVQFAEGLTGCRFADAGELEDYVRWTGLQI